MTVRRFLFATALAVLIGAQTSAAWADGVSAFDGGARGPASAAVTIADVHSTRHAPAKQRETGIFSGENKPLGLGPTTTNKKSTATGGGSILRTLLGLAVVVGLIYAVTWVLRRVKRSREEQASGRGLASVATLPLGGGRTLHLVRAGTDVILVGSSEHGVAPIARYTEEEALANGVLTEAGQEAVMTEAAGAPTTQASALSSVESPGQWRAVDPAGARSTTTIIDALRRLTVRS